MRLVLLFALLAPLAVAQETATYRVTFASTWSAETHPDGFPTNPHYSRLVSVAHAPEARLWEAGATASDGIEQMAETGGTSGLVAGAAALAATGQAAPAAVGPRMALSPGAAEMTVEVTADFPALSVVTMLAPSPDWFVGVSALDLREGDGWAAEVVVPLYVYDAGTDSGTAYTSPDEDTQPREPIARITTPPFEVGGSVWPVGTMTFTRTGASASEADPKTAAFALDPPAPNPVRDRARLMLHLNRAQAVRVAAFDVLGRRVAVLHDGPLGAGAHPLALEAAGLPSGVYLIRAQGEGVAVAQRVTVQR